MQFFSIFPQGKQS
jgi:hypothetical protein